MYLRCTTAVPSGTNVRGSIDGFRVAGWEHCMRGIPLDMRRAVLYTISGGVIGVAFCLAGAASAEAGSLKPAPATGGGGTTQPVNPPPGAGKQVAATAAARKTTSAAPKA